MSINKIILQGRVLKLSSYHHQQELIAELVLATEGETGQEESHVIRFSGSKARQLDNSVMPEDKLYIEGRLSSKVHIIGSDLLRSSDIVGRSFHILPEPGKLIPEPVLAEHTQYKKSFQLPS